MDTYVRKQYYSINNPLILNGFNCLLANGFHNSYICTEVELSFLKWKVGIGYLVTHCLLILKLFARLIMILGPICDLGNEEMGIIVLYGTLYIEQHESLMEKSQFKKEIAHYELAFRRTAKKN